MACAAKFGVMLALASAAMAAPIDRGLDTRSPARPPMVSPDDHPRSARRSSAWSPATLTPPWNDDPSTITNWDQWCEFEARENCNACTGDEGAAKFCTGMCVDDMQCSVEATYTLDTRGFGSGSCPTGYEHITDPAVCKIAGAEVSPGIGNQGIVHPEHPVHGCFRDTQHNRIYMPPGTTNGGGHGGHMAPICMRAARAAIGVCLGDRATFNPFPHWGTVCSSYAEGGTNRDYCNDDKDADGRSAAEVCSECGACRPNYPAGTKMHHNDGAQCQSGNAGLWNDQKDGHVTYCCRTGKKLNNWAKGWCADMENNDRCIFDGQCKSGYCRNGMSRNGVCGTPPPPPQSSTPPPPSYLAPGTHCDTRPNHHPSCNKCKNAQWVYTIPVFGGATRCCSATGC